MQKANVKLIFRTSDDNENMSTTRTRSSSTSSNTTSPSFSASSSASSLNIPSIPSARKSSLRTPGSSSRKGYLDKRGKHNTAFKNRWFIIDDQQLYYFKSRSHTKSMGSVDLREAHARPSPRYKDQWDVRCGNYTPGVGYEVHRMQKRAKRRAASFGDSDIHASSAYQDSAAIDAAGSNSPSYFYFQVITPKRIYELRSVSRKDMQEWVRCINEQSIIFHETFEFDDAADVISGVEFARAQTEQSQLEHFLDLRAVLDHKLSLGFFMAWAEKNHCDEYITFWLEAEQYRLLCPANRSTDESGAPISHVGTHIPLDGGSRSLIASLSPELASRTASVGRSSASSVSTRSSLIAGPVDAQGRRQLAKKVYDKYLCSGARFEIGNVDRKMLDRVQGVMNSTNANVDSECMCFVDIQKTIFFKLEVELFVAFAESADFQRMLLMLPIPLDFLQDPYLHHFNGSKYEQSDWGMVLPDTTDEEDADDEDDDDEDGDENGDSITNVKSPPSIATPVSGSTPSSLTGRPSVLTIAEEETSDLKQHIVDDDEPPSPPPPPPDLVPPPIMPRVRSIPVIEDRTVESESDSDSEIPPPPMPVQVQVSPAAQSAASTTSRPDKHPRAASMGLPRPRTIIMGDEDSVPPITQHTQPNVNSNIARPARASTTVAAAAAAAAAAVSPSAVLQQRRTHHQRDSSGRYRFDARRPPSRPGVSTRPTSYSEAVPSTATGAETTTKSHTASQDSADLLALLSQIKSGASAASQKSTLPTPAEHAPSPSVATPMNSAVATAAAVVAAAASVAPSAPSGIRRVYRVPTEFKHGGMKKSHIREERSHTASPLPIPAATRPPVPHGKVSQFKKRAFPPPTVSTVNTHSSTPQFEPPSPLSLGSSDDESDDDRENLSRANSSNRDTHSSASTGTSSVSASVIPKQQKKKAANSYMSAYPVMPRGTAVHYNRKRTAPTHSAGGSQVSRPTEMLARMRQRRAQQYAAAKAVNAANAAANAANAAANAANAASVASVATSTATPVSAGGNDAAALAAKLNALQQQLSAARSGPVRAAPPRASQAKPMQLQTAAPAKKSQVAPPPAPSSSVPTTGAHARRVSAAAAYLSATPTRRLSARTLSQDSTAAGPRRKIRPPPPPSSRAKNSKK
jgi:PH domain/Regulator of G protein signaling domain